MNSYTILGNSGDASAVSAETCSILLYAFMFGESLRISGDSTNGSVIDFQLPFSLSNVSSETASFKQGMYDTNCQQVFEFVDKPYAVKGYLACAIFTSSSEAYGNKDFDNYRKLWLKADGGEMYTAFIGTVNSTNTDFYEPLLAATFITYMDVASSLTSYMKQSQISAQAIGQGLQRELNPSNLGSPQTADSFVSARAETRPKLYTLK